MIHSVNLLSKPSLLRTATQTRSKALVLLSSQHHQPSPRRSLILIQLVTLALGTHFLLLPIPNLVFRICNLHQTHQVFFKSSSTHLTMILIFLLAYSPHLVLKFQSLNNRVPQYQHLSFLPVETTCTRDITLSRYLQPQTCLDKLHLGKLYNHITWFLIHKIRREPHRFTMEASCTSLAQPFTILE